MTTQVQTEISHHDYLETLGLVVNTTLHCLCCEWCQIALEPNQVPGHIKHSHPGLSARINMTKFQDTLQELDVMECLPDLCTNEGPIPPFDGIKVYKAIRCTHCNSVAVQEGTMRKHHQKEHRELKAPTRWPECCAQRLTLHGKAAQFFEVIQPHPVHHAMPIQTLVNDLRTEISQVADVEMATLNARSISPWLLSTRWHEHIEGYETLELLELVAVPKEGEFPGLKGLLFQYMEHATALIPITAELLLQRLNTGDPAKG
jgi:hypothetical protein